VSASPSDRDSGPVRPGAEETSVDVYTRRLPPIGQVTVASIAVVLTGGVYLATYLPRHAPLDPAFAFLGVAAALLACTVVMLARVRPFAWRPFFVVARWAVLGYLVFAGLLEYVFVLDGTRGGLLVVLTLMLLVYAVDIPMLLAFSVARYQPVAEP
jgi:hypothetical protein